MVILSQVFVNVVIGVYYHLNKAYITQKLCENKNNPKLHCNGHCYLTKQLKKAEEGEQKQSQNILKEKEEIISNNNVMVSVTYFPAYRITEFKAVNPFLYFSDSERSLLKPPTV